MRLRALNSVVKVSGFSDLQRLQWFERMNITGVTGLTEAQKASLRALGAVEDG
jgi:hypothetical protein